MERPVCVKRGGFAQRDPYPPDNTRVAVQVCFDFVFSFRLPSVDGFIRCCADKYCPRGSAAPTVVAQGYYTIGGNESTRVSRLQCEL